MADNKPYPVALPAEAASHGIEAGYNAYKTPGILYGDGQGGIRTAQPGTDYGYPLIQGNGPPGGSTVANLGQHYFDMTATKPPYEYICVGYTAFGFVWTVYGDPGTGFQVLGRFSSLEALEAAVAEGLVPKPSPGDAYFIGEVAPYDMYFWDIMTQSWAYYGPLSGYSGGTMPPHGFKGQALMKDSNIDFDASWSDVALHGQGAPAMDTAAAFVGQIYVDDSTNMNKLYAATGFAPTASGSIASFDDGAEDIPVKSLVVNIEPVQAGTGEPSPENVRPISGWTGVNVTKCGKNFFPKDLDAISEVTYYTADDSPIKRNGWIIPLKAGTYTLSASFIGDPSEVYIYGSLTYDLHTPRFSEAALIIGVSITKRTITFEQDGYWLVYDGLTGQTLAQSRVAFEKVNVQCELASSATAYEPYQGDTYDISFPDEVGTVYGGTLDVTTGLLTVDKAMVEFDGSADEGWISAPDGRAYISVNNYRSPNIDVVDTICSDRLKTVSRASLPNNVYAISGSTEGASTVQIRLDGNVVTSDAVKAWLKSNPVQASYPLAVPITYQLTPTEVTTLLGMNNIWADAGTIEVTYAGTAPDAGGKTIWTALSDGSLMPEGSVTTGKLANLSVTRAKLAQDALYSPMHETGAVAAYSFSVGDLGKTVAPSSSASSVDVVFTMSADVSAAMPYGAEIAVLYRYGKSLKIVFETGASSAIVGDTVFVANRTYSIPERFGMVALKKVDYASSSNVQYWLVTGPVEVAT